jgi:hypothetical protein
VVVEGEFLDPGLVEAPGQVHGREARHLGPGAATRPFGVDEVNVGVVPRAEQPGVAGLAVQGVGAQQERPVQVGALGVVDRRGVTVGDVAGAQVLPGRTRVCSPVATMTAPTLG